MQKKTKKFFQIAKINMQKKKNKIIFQKKMQKKAKMKKNDARKACRTLKIENMIRMTHKPLLPLLLVSYQW